MKKTRLKTPVNPPLMLADREEAEACARALAERVNAQRHMLAQRDAQILNVNAFYESALTAIAEAIKSRTLALQQWAEANPDEFPKGRKSLDLASALLGFRTGTPKLALRSRAWNWDSVLAAVKAAARRFVRTKEEVDKDAILGEFAAGAIDDATLATLGVKVTQDEYFFVEPKLADTDARQTNPTPAAEAA
jgi:phage host-nuclease inhibitor protein Gam